MKTLLLSLSLHAFLGVICHAGIEKVEKTEEDAWLKYVLPLPHEIKIHSKCLLSAKDIGFKLQNGAGEIEKNAIFEMKKFIEDKTGIKPNGSKFEILVGVPDGEDKVCGVKVNNLERLKKLPNNEQAYTIQPSGDNKLIIAALNPKGIYYGAVTLRQLLAKNIDKTGVTIPMAEIIDWPDLKFRGSWSHLIDRESLIWESGFKLNFSFPAYWTFILKKRTKNSPSWKDWEIKVDKKELEIEILHAFKRGKRVFHFNFPFWYETFKKYYPELLGKGENSWQILNKPNYKSGPPRQYQCPCASNPLFEDLLASLMEASAKEGVNQLLMWTTEFWGQCECDKCKNENQFVLETRALTNAWKRVKKKYPNFKIQIFYSFSKNYSNGRVCRKLPSDTGDKVVNAFPQEITEVGRACYGRSNKVNTENPPFDKLALKGHVLCSYCLPPLGFKVLRSDMFSCKKRIRNLLDSKWQGGFAFDPLREAKIDSESYVAFQLAAVAEWGWNNQGRNISQFAEAWAVVNNYNNPEKFVEFITITEPLIRKIGRIDFRHKSSFKKAVEGKSQWPFSTGKTENLEICRQALKLTEEIGRPQWVLEAKTLMTYLEVNYAAGEIIAAISNKKDKSTLKTAGDDFKTAVKRMRSVLKERKMLYGKKMPANSAFNKGIINNLTAFEKEVDSIIKK